MTITINTTLKSKQDILNKQLQSLEKIGEFTPSFGPARVALIEAIYQCRLCIYEAKEEEIKKNKSFSIAAAFKEDDYNNDLDDLKVLVKELGEERLQMLEAARSFKHPNSQIEYAFTCGGVDYFRFSDFNNMPAMRSTKTLVYYTEMDMRCDAEFLKWHCLAVNNILTNNEKIDIYKLKELNDQILQRIDIAVDMEHLYKIASIIYFDKDENYEDYDFGYNTRKINSWKKHDGVAFFLREPLQALFPFLKDTEENLKTYSKIVSELTKKHAENILSQLPPKLRDRLKSNSSFYQTVTQAS